uniref:Chitin-binding type-2 domain-containing protein n=1 Tax=Stomoxys calcitrans TaxID=35570 RepID=A0A1I8PDR2_STOCA
MKNVLSFFVCLACFLAFVSACDPDSDNKPVCNDMTLNVPTRNFWDPTAYWLCNYVGVEPELERCPDSHLFDSAKGECVLWNKWVWTNPCPATI